MSKIKIGFQAIAMHGNVPRMREAWMEAEAMGADRIYSSDHINPLGLNTDVLEGDQQSVTQVEGGMVYEGTTMQAAIAATTMRAEIGCLVHANSFRDPYMMAYIAGTLDHLSGGRFILGMGTGIYAPDYQSLRLDYGTQMSRTLDMARDLPLIRAAFDKLRPQPLRRIPILIASMGEKVGLRLVAEHADIWNFYGPLDVLQRKIDVLRNWCDKVGRKIDDIEFSTYYWPEMLKDADLDKYRALGITEMTTVTQGPDWDRGILREMIAWRNNLG